MSKLSHNKRRNIGLVYEFLSREITDAVIRQDRKRASVALSLIEGHLSPEGNLFEELTLHRQVMETRGASERLARRIIDGIRSASVRLQGKKRLIENAKTQLIHDINRTVGPQIFDRHRIPNYTVHASIGVIFQHGLGNISEGVGLARIEDTVIDYMRGQAEAVNPWNREASAHVYQNALKIFQEEYGSVLSEAEGQILREFVLVSLGGNPEPFRRLFERQRDELRKNLTEARRDEIFIKNEDFMRRLDEGIAELTGMTPSTDESTVERLMLFHRLNCEIKEKKE